MNIKMMQKAVLGAAIGFATTLFAALSSREVREYDGAYPDAYTFEKIKSDGTLRARTTDPWSSAAIVIKNYDEFAGSIETECAVVFGENEDPERSGTGLIVIPEDKTVTITGAGKVDDFASAADLPWAGRTVTNVTLAMGVTPSPSRARRGSTS